MHDKLWNLPFLPWPIHKICHLPAWWCSWFTHSLIYKVTYLNGWWKLLLRKWIHLVNGKSRGPICHFFLFVKGMFLQHLCLLYYSYCQVFKYQVLKKKKSITSLLLSILSLGEYQARKGRCRMSYCGWSADASSWYRFTSFVRSNRRGVIKNSKSTLVKVTWENIFKLSLHIWDLYGWGLLAYKVGPYSQ